MALLSDVARSFPSVVRQRGDWIYRGGNVKIVSGNPSSVEALVKGSHKYEVSLQRSSEVVRVNCTCPYFETEGPCKHIWATLLASVDRNYLDASSPDRPARIIEDWEMPELSAAKKEAPAKWKQALANIHQQGAVRPFGEPEAWPDQREVFFIVDPSTVGGGIGASFSFKVEVRDLGKSGKHGKLKELKLLRKQIADIPDERDRRILAALAGATPSTYSFMGGMDFMPTSFALALPLGLPTLRDILETGRCMLRREYREQPDRMQRLEWDPLPPWEFRAVIHRDGPQYSLNGVLLRDDQKMDVRVPNLLFSDGLLLAHNRLSRFEPASAFHWLIALRREGAIPFPAKDAVQFQVEVLKGPKLPQIDWPEDMRFEDVHAAPRPTVRIGRNPKVYAAETNSLRAELYFDYGAVSFPWDHAESGFFDAVGRRFIRRDRSFEGTVLERMEQIGMMRNQDAYGPPDSAWELSEKRLPSAVGEMLKAGWHVEAEGKVFQTASSFDMQVTSGIDWFELHGSVQYGSTTVGLPVLLQALRKGETMLRLDDGTFGLLPEEFLQKFGPLLRMGETEEDHVRYSRAQAGILDVFLAERDVQVDEEFQKARERLRGFQGMEPAEQPEQFQGELRHYQREGLAWLNFLNAYGWGGCLADDMGVGKTAQVLALLEQRRMAGAGPSLVVVPRSLIYNWQQEAGRFTPLLRVLDNSGAARTKDPRDFLEYNVVLTTYGTLRRDVVDFREFEFDYVILDEAQAIKNSSSESAKAARLLRSKHRLAMSGTPIENHLGELWSLFEFLNPGMLGGVSVFQSASGAMRNPDELTRVLLSRAVRPFILRRTKSQVVKELPEKTEQTIYCELDANQRKLYNELRDYYRGKLLGRISEKGMGRSKFQVLEALLRLRQAACHPALIDEERVTQASAKFETLLPQLEEVTAEGHKALVFSQFTSLLSLLRTQLDAGKVPYEYLDGATRNRQERVERFQSDPDCKLFLISLKAGGLGLNLTAADYVFLLDPWWNPAVEAQAIDRTHRIGQTRPVFAYRLIARDTVEEKVLELQRTKRELADAIITEDNRFLGNLRPEDLEILFS
ncbi:MAG: DEAD/DEAH box helicase [Acidobacteria bacterium]|nr:DEAD/DEAH box helicase [Acidobacteriota bacterium]